MATILTSTIIENATAAVDTYIASVTSLADGLATTISTLTTTNFNGDAANGYNIFYTTKVKPALTDNLTGAQGLMVGIKNILDGLKVQLLDTVDVQLGENNQNPGGDGTTTAAG